MALLHPDCQVLLVTFPDKHPAPAPSPAAAAAGPGSLASRTEGQQALLQLARTPTYALPSLSLPPGSVLAELVEAASGKVGADRQGGAR